MTLTTLTAKYIASTQKVMKNIHHTKHRITITEENITNILSHAANYLEDAKYYKAQKKLETSLTSIAYCEGY